MSMRNLLETVDIPMHINLTDDRYPQTAIQPCSSNFSTLRNPQTRREETPIPSFAAQSEIPRPGTPIFLGTPRTRKPRTSTKCWWGVGCFQNKYRNSTVHHTGSSKSYRECPPLRWKHKDRDLNPPFTYLKLRLNDITEHVILRTDHIERRLDENTYFHHKRSTPANGGILEHKMEWLAEIHKQEEWLSSRSKPKRLSKILMQVDGAANTEETKPRRVIQLNRPPESEPIAYNHVTEITSMISAGNSSKNDGRESKASVWSKVSKKGKALKGLFSRKKEKKSKGNITSNGTSNGEDVETKTITSTEGSSGRLAQPTEAVVEQYEIEQSLPHASPEQSRNLDASSTQVRNRPSQLPQRRSRVLIPNLRPKLSSVPRLSPRPVPLITHFHGGEIEYKGYDEPNFRELQVFPKTQDPFDKRIRLIDIEQKERAQSNKFLRANSREHLAAAGIGRAPPLRNIDAELSQLNKVPKSQQVLPLNDGQPISSNGTSANPETISGPFVNTPAALHRGLSTVDSGFQEESRAALDDFDAERENAAPSLYRGVGRDMYRASLTENFGFEDPVPNSGIATPFGLAQSHSQVKFTGSSRSASLSNTGRPQRRYDFITSTPAHDKSSVRLSTARKENVAPAKEVAVFESQLEKWEKDEVENLEKLNYSKQEILGGIRKGKRLLPRAITTTDGGNFIQKAAGETSASQQIKLGVNDDIEVQERKGSSEVDKLSVLLETEKEILVKEEAQVEEDVQVKEATQAKEAIDFEEAQVKEDIQVKEAIQVKNEFQLQEESRVPSPAEPPTHRKFRMSVHEFLAETDPSIPNSPTSERSSATLITPEGFLYEGETHEIRTCLSTWVQRSSDPAATDISTPNLISQALGLSQPRPRPKNPEELARIHRALRLDQPATVGKVASGPKHSPEPKPSRPQMGKLRHSITIEDLVAQERLDCPVPIDELVAEQQTATADPGVAEEQQVVYVTASDNKLVFVPYSDDVTAQWRQEGRERKKLWEEMSKRTSRGSTSSASSVPMWPRRPAPAASVSSRSSSPPPAAAAEPLRSPTRSDATSYGSRGESELEELRLSMEVVVAESESESESVSEPEPEPEPEFEFGFGFEFEFEPSSARAPTDNAPAAIGKTSETTVAVQKLPLDAAGLSVPFPRAQSTDCPQTPSIPSSSSSSPSPPFPPPLPHHSLRGPPLPSTFRSPPPTAGHIAPEDQLDQLHQLDHSPRVRSAYHQLVRLRPPAQPAAPPQTPVPVATPASASTSPKKPKRPLKAASRFVRRVNGHVQGWLRRPRPTFSKRAAKRARAAAPTRAPPPLELLGHLVKSGSVLPDGCRRIFPHDPASEFSFPATTQMAERLQIRPAEALRVKAQSVEDARQMQAKVIEECKRAGKDPPPYGLEELIGKGSFGRVYKGKDMKSAQTVAIKIIDIDESDTVNPRNADSYSEFLKEVNALKILGENKAKNINCVIAAIPVGKAMWMVTEYCGGGSVATLMKPQPKGLDEKWIVPIAREVGEAIKWVHQAGIIHRDIKCANVLITEQGDVQLCDFGVAGIVETKVQKRMTVIGTPHWMAPEQFSPGTSYGTEVDIWAFGCMIYEMATGYPPNATTVHQADLPDYLRSHAPPRLEGGNYSDNLRGLVAYCLDENAASRPPIEDVQKHPYIAGTANSHPTSSLRTLVGAFSRWEAKGGARKSLFFQHGAQAPSMSSPPNSIEWNFSTTEVFQNAVQDEFTAKDVYEAYPSVIDFDESTARVPKPKRGRQPPPKALARMPGPLEKVFDSNTQSNYEDNSRVHYGRQMMPPPTSDLPLRDDNAQISIRDTMIDLGGHDAETGISSFADMDTIKPIRAYQEEETIDLDSADPDFSRPALSDPADIGNNRRTQDWKFPSFPPASADPEMSRFPTSFEVPRPAFTPGSGGRPALIHHPTEPVGNGFGGELSLMQPNMDRLSMRNSLIDLDSAMADPIPEYRRPSTAISDAGSATSEHTTTTANPFELEGQAPQYQPIQTGTGREPSIYVSDELSSVVATQVRNGNALQDIVDMSDFSASDAEGTYNNGYQDIREGNPHYESGDDQFYVTENSSQPTNGRSGNPRIVQYDSATDEYDSSSATTSFNSDMAPPPLPSLNTLQSQPSFISSISSSPNDGNNSNGIYRIPDLIDHPSARVLTSQATSEEMGTELTRMLSGLNSQLGAFKSIYEPRDVIQRRVSGRRGDQGEVPLEEQVI